MLREEFIAYETLQTLLDVPSIFLILILYFDSLCFWHRKIELLTIIFTMKKATFACTHKTLAEKAMAPHSSTLAWKVPWMEKPGRLQSMGLLRVGTTERLHFRFSLSCIGEGNGNPLQCSCLDNPRDGGAWWAAIYGVAQSQTQLKQLSSSSKHSKQKSDIVR